MTRVRMVVTGIAIVIYCCIAWFYGIGPALLSLVIWTLGQVDGREEYNEIIRRKHLEQE